MDTNMRHNRTRLYMGDVLESKLVTAEGKKLGHIADVELTPGPEYRVTKLLYGERGWLHRLHVLNPFVERKSSHKPNSVPWGAVDRIEGSRVILKAGWKPHDGS